VLILEHAHDGAFGIMPPNFLKRRQHRAHQFKCANLASQADACRPGRAASPHANHQHIFRIGMDQRPDRAQELMDRQEGNVPLAEALDEEGTLRRPIRPPSVSEEGNAWEKVSTARCVGTLWIYIPPDARLRRTFSMNSGLWSRPEWDPCGRRASA